MAGVQATSQGLRCLKRGPPQRPLMCRCSAFDLHMSAPRVLRCCAMHGWEGVAARLLGAEAPLGKDI